MREKIIIFGASKSGQLALQKLNKDHDVVFFSDNDKNKWRELFCNIEIIDPKEIENLDYDKIVIASSASLDIALQLHEVGIDKLYNFHETKVCNIKDIVPNDPDCIMDTVIYQSHSARTKVACILDEFSRVSFKDACLLKEITPFNWQEVLEDGVDFLLVESAWHGVNGTWRGLRNYFSKEKVNNGNRVVSLVDDILDKCKKLNIPTVFWNKEDPIHFEGFIELAKKFDYIFTTDKNMVEKYVEELGRDRVYVLPFAANLATHNPIDKDVNKKNNVAFAGSWYENHEDRKKDMETVLLATLDMGVEIYDRNFGKTSNENNIFPEKYRNNIVGSLPYEQMNEYYKKHRVFLNTNTVQNSPSMFSRRVFELLASGTNVVSGYALGIERMLGDVVLIGNNSSEVRAHVQKLLDDKLYSDKLSIKGIREVVNKHTYVERLNFILEKINIDKGNYTEEKNKGIVVVSFLNSLLLLENVVNNFVRQAYSNKELVIVVDDGVTLGIQEVIIKVQYLKKKLGNEDAKVNLLVKDKNEEMKKKITESIENSKQQYIAVFHEKAFYGENYLVDLLNAFKYTDAQVVGKASTFVYSVDKEKLDMFCPDREHRYVDEVHPHTIVINKDIFSEMNEVIFDKENINLYMKELIKKEIKIYSIDRFNFVELGLANGNLLSSRDNILKEVIDYITV